MSLLTAAAGTCLQAQAESHTPASELELPHDRDLRARTLTSLLAALSPVTDSLCNTAKPFNITQEGTSASDNTTTQQRSPSDSSTNASQTWLKVLNQVAQLLVREHEIVAVLPRRSGRTANVDLLVATDSSSDDDDDRNSDNLRKDDDDPRSSISSEDHGVRMNPIDGYLIARNARFNSPEPSPGNPFGKLIEICSPEDMLQYLNTYRHVSYRNHVRGIEVLFNAIVNAWNTFTTVHDAHFFDFTPIPVQEAYGHFIRRKALLRSFVTFYSVGKMRRRFHSKPFVAFNTEMASMRQAQVEAAFVLNFKPGESPLFTDTEMCVFEALLTDDRENSYPGLSAILSASRENNTNASYTKETAWDLHRLLLSVLHRAQSTVDTLYTQITSAPTSPFNFSTSLPDVENSMDRLHFLVHSSPSISAHMKSVESILSRAMVSRPTSELDQDEGVTDTSIEISVAYQQKRVGEECLWLAVRYQAALNSLTAEDTLPAEPVTLTLYEVSAGVRSKNELHDWKGVVRSIYSSHANSGSKSTTNMNISCEEAIQTLEEWARLEENRVLRATHILRKSSHEFYGCWHAEAVLGTLRHLSQFDRQKTFLPANIELAPFEHTFPNIGVSKRCCPVCVKLLSLLAPPFTSNDISDPSIVLSVHQNFYPSALPPYLPRGIAVKLLVWLEGLVRGAVGGLVMKRRLEKSKETAGSEEKVARAKSADSKGESPRKMVKRKRVKEPGLTDVMRQMGFVANGRVTE